MSFQPTDLQTTRLRRAFVELKRFPGWSVIKQFYTAEASLGSDADLLGLTKFLLGLFEESLNLEAEFATTRINKEGYVAAD